MKTTTYLGLKKIELTDSPPDITVQDYNWDKIDEELSKALKSDTPVAIIQGGTGGKTAADARVNLGLKDAATKGVDTTPTVSSKNLVESGGVFTAVNAIKPITQGGTGATTVADARTNLGLGDAATKGVDTTPTASSKNLVESGGVFTAVNATKPVTQGGTGATTVSGARTNLGLGSAAVKGTDTTPTSSSTNLVESGGAYTAINAVKPVTQGGTGATSKAGARGNLGITVAATAPISPVNGDLWIW